RKGWSTAGPSHYRSSRRSNWSCRMCIAYTSVVMQPCAKSLPHRMRRRHLSLSETLRRRMGMGRNSSIGLLALFLALTVGSMPVVAQQHQKPNVVFILADNVGYGDMAPYGGGKLRGMPTPRTDQLAQEGLRLTQFLVEPICSPSRAALMT